MAVSSRIGPIGIKNDGNTCYINAVLQILLATLPREIKQKLKDIHPWEYDKANYDQKQVKLFNLVIKILKELEQPASGPIEANGVPSVLEELFDWGVGTQQDASELYMKLMEIILKALESERDFGVEAAEVAEEETSVAPSLSTLLMELLKKDKSLRDQNNLISFVSLEMRRGCPHISSKAESSLIFQVSVPVDYELLVTIHHLDVQLLGEEVVQLIVPLRALTTMQTLLDYCKDAFDSISKPGLQVVILESMNGLFQYRNYSQESARLLNPSAQLHFFAFPKESNPFPIYHRVTAYYFGTPFLITASTYNSFMAQLYSNYSKISIGANVFEQLAQQHRTGQILPATKPLFLLKSILLAGNQYQDPTLLLEGAREVTASNFVELEGGNYAIVVECDETIMEFFFGADSRLEKPFRNVDSGEAQDDVVVGGVVELVDLLRIESKQFRMDYRCEKEECKEKEDFSQTTTVPIPPPLFVFALKRFDSSLNKIQRDVKFPIEDWIIPHVLAPNLSTLLIPEGGPVVNLEEKGMLDEVLRLRDITYDLVGIINHLGDTMESGHYTCYCINDSQWYELDDAKVTEVDLDAKILHNAFMLFYRRRSVGAPDDYIEEGGLFYEAEEREEAGDGEGESG